MSVRPSVPEPATLVDELLHRFAAADRWGAVAWTRALLRDGVDDRTIRRAVGAAVHRVGELWQAGTWTVSQEHAATAVAEAVLGVLERADGPATSAGTVAVVAADGEWHALPARLAAHAFERVELRVHYLGAGVPAADVAASLPTAEVDVLAVSVTVTANLRGAARTVAAGRAARVPVLLGGAASDPDRARALGAHAHAPDVDTGADLAAAWCRDGTPPAPEPTVDLAAADRVRAGRAGLLDAAYTAAAARWPALADADEDLVDRTIEDLELHLDHLVAAVLLGDASIHRDLVTWFAAVHAGRGSPPELAAAQLDGVVEAVTADPAIARLVAPIVSRGRARSDEPRGS